MYVWLKEQHADDLPGVTEGKGRLKQMANDWANEGDQASEVGENGKRKRTAGGVAWHARACELACQAAEHPIE